MTTTPNPIILTFHGVGQPPRPLSPAEQQVWLSADSFNAILDLAAQRSDLLLTFDDGNDSDIRLALPALLQRNLSASFFVLAGKIDQPAWLSRHDLQTLHNAGMSIGLHGMHHCPWRHLTDPQLSEELIDARKILQDILGQPITQAACPFGSYGRHTLHRLRAANYQRLYTSDRGRATPHAWLQPRNTVHHTDDPSTIHFLLTSDNLLSSAFRQTKHLIKRWR